MLVGIILQDIACYFQNPDQRSCKDKSFFAFASYKNQSFLELKTQCSAAYGRIVLCLFSKLTGKLENILTQQLPKNDVFLMSFFSLRNDAF